MTTVQPVGQRPPWVDDELFPFESRFVDIGGSTVHYVDEGSGPVMLMLHGNPVWSFVYRDVIARLAGRFRCIAVDFPGFGLSAGAPGYRYLARDHAEFLVSFVDRLALSHVTLVGHNWGGPLGLYAGMQRPDLFDRLILANTWAWPLNGDLASEVFARGMGGLVGRALIKQFNLMVDCFIPVAHKRRKPADAEMAHYRHAMPTPQQRHACAVLPGELVAARTFFTELAAGIGALQKLPALIVWADADPIFTGKYLTRLEATFPNHTTTVLPGVGHFAQSDAPAEFADAIQAWWTQDTTGKA